MIYISVIPGHIMNPEGRQFVNNFKVETHTHELPQYMRSDKGGKTYRPNT